MATNANGCLPSAEPRSREGAPVIVERTDYVSLPVTDLERSIRFYEETLELPRAEGGGSWPEFLTGNVSLYLMDPTNIGAEFTGPHTAYIALRVRGRPPELAPSSSRKAWCSRGRSSTRGSATWRSSRIPDGNALMLHRRYAP